MYSPTAGRFLTRDPSGESGGVNLYEYADDDPVNLYDPTGEAPQSTQPSNRPSTRPSFGGYQSVLSAILPPIDDAEEARLQYNRAHLRIVPGYGKEKLTAEQYEALAQVAIQDADTWMTRGNEKMVEVEVGRANLALMFAKMQHDLEAGNIAKTGAKEALATVTTIPGMNEMKAYAEAIHQDPPQYDLAALYIVAAYLALEGTRLSVVKGAGALRQAVQENGTAGNIGVIARRNMDFTTVVDSQGKQVGIFGQWEKSTSTTPFHNDTIGLIAKEKAASGDYVYLTTQRNLRTTIGLSIPGLSDDIPDIIGVRRDGKIDVFEVCSQDQTIAEMKAKCISVLNTLPKQMRGIPEAFTPRNPGG